MTRSHDDAANICKPKGKLFEPMSTDFANDNNYKAITAKYAKIYPDKDDSWIGIKDNTADGTADNWIYISSNDVVKDFFWKGSGDKQQPKNGNGECLFFSGNNAKWSNGGCDTTKNFICEFTGKVKEVSDNSFSLRN